MRAVRALALAAVVLVCTAAPASAAPWRHHRVAAPAVVLHAASFALAVPAVRWDACAAVDWTFNPAGAPVGGEEAVTAAVARVAVATGLRFSYVGPSDAVPDSAAMRAGVLLIGWTTPAASSLLAGQVAGLTGMEQNLFTGSRIVGGVIALDADLVAPATGPGSWYLFALHELGHAVGLAHTTDGSQVMSATIPTAALDYGTGDLAGLAAAGGTCAS